MLKLTFTSVLPLSYRDDLEGIVFFNPHQARFIDPLLAAVNSYGVPAIVEEDERRLRLGVPAFRSIQTLYALDDSAQGDPGNPVLPVLAGVVAFVRENEETMLILHLAVHQDYTADGSKADGWVAMRLMSTVRDIARRTRGLAWLRVLYPKPALYPVPRSFEANL